jgi:hypothetical protein
MITLFNIFSTIMSNLLHNNDRLFLLDNYYLKNFEMDSFV